jgi:hypothetical protein
MNLLFAAMFAAAVLHVLEEYKLPGGFLDLMRRVRPGWASAVTPGFAVAINAAFLALCAAAILWGEAQPVFGLSVAGLLLVNGLAHVAASLRLRTYVPGVVTGLLLYLPLSLAAFGLALHQGQVSLAGAVLSALWGAAYHLVPIGVLFLGSRK